jgi:hypothetical protein
MAAARVGESATGRGEMAASEPEDAVTLLDRGNVVAEGQASAITAATGPCGSLEDPYRLFTAGPEREVA